MATYETRLSAAGGEARLDRRLQLSWSALWGGGVIGWGCLFVLSLVGATIGLANVETRAMDGENLDLAEQSFDHVISRVGLIYFPDQHKALSGMRRVLKPGGRVAAITYSTPENNRFFSIPVSIIRRRAQLPPPLPGQPGPFTVRRPPVPFGPLSSHGRPRVAHAAPSSYARTMASYAGWARSS